MSGRARAGGAGVVDDLPERWLTYGTFVEMVGRGFIGRETPNTETIIDQLRAALGDGRSVTLAIGGPVRHRPAASR